MQLSLKLLVAIATSLVLASCGGGQIDENHPFRFPYSTKSSEVYLQGFNWSSISHRGSHYNELLRALPHIVEMKFDGMWFPPATESVDAQGYMPTKWFSLVNQPGLQKLIVQLRHYNILSIADVVVNHRSGSAIAGCAGTEWIQFEEPALGPEAVVSNDRKCEGEVQAKPMFCPSSCSCGAADTGDNFCGSPDLDHTNMKVQDGVVEYLQFLSTIGFGGWRFDMVKGYNGKFVKLYMERTEQLVKEQEKYFVVGEYFDADVNRVTQWMNEAGGSSTVFDFPFRFLLKSGIQRDEFSGLKFGGVLSHSSRLSSTFLDNHDTSREDRFGGDRENMMGYAVILTHPGTPFVYWDDFLNLRIRGSISKLIELRKQAGINAGSSFYVSTARQGVYASFVDGDDATLAVKIGRGDWSPVGPDWMLMTFGDSYAVWMTKSNSFTPYLS